MVHLASFLNPHEANTVVGMLRANGINASTLDEHLVNANWSLSNAIGGVKVVVDQNDLERARELLRQTQQELELEQRRCPRCNSIDTELRGGGILRGIFMFLIMTPFGYKTEQMKCNNCQNIWIPE